MKIQGLCGIFHTWDFLDFLPPTFDMGEICLFLLREKEVAICLFVCGNKWWLPVKQVGWLGSPTFSANSHESKVRQEAARRQKLRPGGSHLSF